MNEIYLHNIKKDCEKNIECTFGVLQIRFAITCDQP